MTDRRQFLQLAVTVLLLAPLRLRIGDIRFCRVSHRRWLSFIPPGCIAEVDAATTGVTFLGQNATLVVNGSGLRVYGMSG
jgi:hypothetical protein